MAKGDVYPVPRIRKINGMWRVTWCDVHNRIWYREFYSWRDAMRIVG